MTPPTQPGAAPQQQLAQQPQQPPQAQVSAAAAAQMMEDMRIIGQNVGNLPPGEFGEAMTSLHEFTSIQLAARARGVPASPARRRVTRCMAMANSSRRRRPSASRSASSQIAASSSSASCVEWLLLANESCC